MSEFLSGLLDAVSPIPFSALSTIGGALIGSNAQGNAAGQIAASNNNAAKINADAQAEARKTFLDQSNRGIGYIDAGTNDYAATIAPNLHHDPITLPTYRGLTTQQQLGEADMMRNGMATLAASGLRGASRAGVGAVMDQDARYQAGARSANDADTLGAMRTAKQNEIQSRAGLAQVQAQAGGAKANTAIGAGNQIGQSLQSQGATTAALATKTGDIGAQSTLNTANIMGSTLGGISGIYAGNSPNGGYFNTGGDSRNGGSYPSNGSSA